MPHRKTGLGDTYQAVSGLRKTREWRGLRDTLYDFRWWLTTWKDMIAFVLKSPLQVLKGLWKYRWMATYLTVPAFIDRQLEGNRGGAAPLRASAVRRDNQAYDGYYRDNVQCGSVHRREEVDF